LRQLLTFFVPSMACSLITAVLAFALVGTAAVTFHRERTGIWSAAT